MGTPTHAAGIRKCQHSGGRSVLDEPKAVVVVSISSAIPIAVGRTQPVRFIVPRTPAQHTATSRVLPATVA